MLRKAASSLSPRVRSMRRAFNSWSAVWIQLRSLRRGAMALTQSGLRAGFSSWFEFALLAEEKSRIMASVMAALQQRGVRSALNTWSAFAAEHAEARRQLRSAASAFRGDGVHKAFNTWRDLSATLTRIGRVIIQFSPEGRSFAVRSSSGQPSLRH